MPKRILRVFAVLGMLVASSRLAADEIVRLSPSQTVRQETVITNQNLALVTETRKANLPAGRLELFWEGAPPTARTETWSLSGSRGVRWLGLESIGFARGAPESTEWLKPLVGKTVRVVRPGGTSVDADVLEVHGPTPDLLLFREGANLVYGEPQASLRTPADGSRAQRAAGVYLKLSLEKAGDREISSRYLVASVSWEADYALTLSTDEKSGRLEGWFVVDNGCGAELVPNRLRLLAGALRLASEAQPRFAGGVTGAAAEALVLPSASASEPRVYEIASPGRLGEGRTTFPLAENVAVQVSKRYMVRPFWSVSNADALRVPVAVQYRVATAPLGKALPAGIVRVYAEQGSFFVGESRVPHAPEGTDLDLETAEAFDLVARRQQTAFAQVGPRETESTVEISIVSRKKEPVTVLVRESFPGDWTVLDSSSPPVRRDAFTAEFAVPVPAGSTTKLTFRVRVRAAG